MHCQYCKKTLDNDSVFCKHCGKKNKVGKKINTESPKYQSSKAKKKENSYVQEKLFPNIIEIEIPGKSRDIIKFSDEAVSYKGNIIKYTDIKDISCENKAESINYIIPTKHIFFFMFSGSDSKITVFFETTLAIKLREKQEVFNKIFIICKKIIVPVIVRNLVNRIIKEDETIKIGPVFFNKNGYYTKNLFRKERWIYWKDKEIKPILEQGRYFLIEETSDKYKYFSEIALENPNAIVIPELLETLYSINQTQVKS